jgi:hypothetical protein
MDAIKNVGSGTISGSSRPERNTHGQAALLLTESLMHALVDKGTISREDFIEVVEGAAEVERDLAIANAMSPADRDGSLLSPLATAFRQELGR